MSTQLQSVRDVFVHLISDIPPEQWEQALLKLCPNDAALREQVRRLLTAHQQQDSLLDRPDPEVTSPAATSRDHHVPDHDEVKISQRIGPYKLLQMIGEGGMGMVYMAEQTEPVRRKVALKIIKPGMDTKEVIARFEAERQALALMDHPNIARVLGGGVTEAGRPYFVMDLVHGTPLNKFCDQTRMTTQQRLELFLDVCRAVQHAHQKGIIHRDLKPTNVLVSMDDVRPVPKVIDFGIAKALSQQLTERTLFTAYGHMLGTPLYMSPEQTQYSTQDIDTRSDIYSLGVLLYELMTGSTPFDKETLQRSGYEGMRKMICEVDPPRPSHRVGTLKQAARTTLADQRNVDPRKLQDSLKGELDWIVMKALEKDRNRRYETVSSLAADIQRYLNNEPVLACPPSTVYRARKFISRNKGLIVTGSLTLLALIVGLGTALWQAVRASQAEIRAVSERDRALESERENRSLLYVADIQRAEDAWYDRDAFQMRRILEAQIPGPRQDDHRGFEWHYLMKQQSQLRQELLPRGSPVYYLLRLPDQKLAAAGADGLIRFFDTVSGKVVRTLNSEQGEINGLALSPSGSLFASAGDDGTIVVREFPSMTLKWQVKAHEKQAFQVAFTPDSRAIISAGNEPDARVWDAQTGVQLRLLSTDGFALESVSVSADSQVALGTFSGGVWLFDQDFQRSGVPLPRASRSIARFCHSGQLVAEGYQDGELIIRNMAHPTQVLARWQLPDSVKSIVFSPDNRWLAAGDSTGAVHLLPLSTTEAGAGDASEKASQRVDTESATWHAHEGKIYALEFDEEGQSLFIAGGDGSIVSWRLTESQTSFTEFDNTNDAHFHGSEKILWATRSDLRLTSRDLAPITTVPCSAEWHWLAIARDSGRICATQRNESQIVEIDPETLNSKEVWTVEKNARYQALALSPDGQTLAVSTTLPDSEEEKPAQFLEIVDLKSSRRVIRIPAQAVYDIEFSPDGSCFAYEESNEIHLVETRHWQVLRSFVGHATTVNRIGWSAVGSVLASASSDRTVRLWDPKSGEELWSTVAHRIRARDVAFTPDGRTLVTAGDDGYVRLWNLQSKRLALRIPIRLQQVKHLRVSPDSNQLIVIYVSGECELIDARSTSPANLQASSVTHTSPVHPSASQSVPQALLEATRPLETDSNRPPPPGLLERLSP